MQIRISIDRIGWKIAPLPCPAIDRLCSYWFCNACTVFVPTTLSFAVAVEKFVLALLSILPFHL